MQKQLGFTLIELLIVIAIIGVLTTLVLAGVYQGRMKAYDNSVRNDIRQLRWVAEEAYDANGASYENWSTYDKRTSDIEKLMDDIDKNYGYTPTDPEDPTDHAALIFDSQVQNYCISAPLREGGYYCIDATGVFTTTQNPCSEPTGDDPLRCLTE